MQLASLFLSHTNLGERQKEAKYTYEKVRVLNDEYDYYSLQYYCYCHSAVFVKSEVSDSGKNNKHHATSKAVSNL